MTQLSTQIVIDGDLLDYEPAPPKAHWAAFKPQELQQSGRVSFGIYDLPRPAPSSIFLTSSSATALAKPVEACPESFG